MTRVDYTSDSCAVMVWSDGDDVVTLGGDICGSRFERADDGDWYAMLGEASGDERTDAENDAELSRCREAVEAELSAADIEWEEMA